MTNECKFHTAIKSCSLTIDDCYLLPSLIVGQPVGWGGRTQFDLGMLFEEHHVRFLSKLESKVRINYIDSNRN